MTMKVELTQGKFSTVDKEDFEKVNQYTWKYSNRGYAASNYFEAGKYKTRLMHRVIIGDPKGYFVDHIDGNPLNNRKENLRLVSNVQNTWNQSKGARNTSGYKGVTVKHPKNANQTTRYQATITRKGRKFYLGYFDNPHDAARMYNFWALDLFGEYARLNVIKEDD